LKVDVVGAGSVYADSSTGDLGFRVAPKDAEHQREVKGLRAGGSSHSSGSRSVTVSVWRPRRRSSRSPGTVQNCWLSWYGSRSGLRIVPVG
jgi:hypothetical protein